MTGGFDTGNGSELVLNGADVDVFEYGFFGFLWCRLENHAYLLQYFSL